MDTVNWAREFVIRPRWAAHRVNTALQRWAHNAVHGRPPRKSYSCVSLEAALATVVGRDVGELLRSYEAPALQTPRGNIPASFAASTNLLRVYFVLCRALTPKLIVETGVATG